ncbi:hypothetical protein HMPREF6745_0333 [Prevotella sp. oral taxon 472 str. F0295]|nr:hypothetical protein HMPREF6745_0333 [Prevotella sp. oral taxon 472 str. F0295]
MGCEHVSEEVGSGRGIKACLLANLKAFPCQVDKFAAFFVPY